MTKELLTITAIALTFVGFAPYIRSIRRGETTPHVFSWVIWGLTTFVVFLAQLAGGAGFGAWPVGVSGIITIYIGFLAYRKRADVEVTRSDWIFFWAALSALPLWFFTADPFWAVVILTIVDVAGFGPTIRRAYTNPGDEHIGFYLLFTIRNVLVIMALQHYSITTVLFPAAVGVGCLVVVFILAWRRNLE